MMDGTQDTHPMRRQIEATDWAIKGELFLNCNCTVFCPCVVSLGQHAPTEGYWSRRGWRSPLMKGISTAKI